MFALAAIASLIAQVSGTPYIPGGDTPAGTDCSGLASWVANVASGRPAFGSRFNTGNIEPALLARGFHYGSAPNSVVIGWNGSHAAVTLPDGTPVSSGESGSGVRVGGGGAYQSQFTHHMYLPVQAEEMNVEAKPADPAEAVLPADPGAAAPDALPADAPAPGALPGDAPAPDALPGDAPAPDALPADPAMEAPVDHLGGQPLPDGLMAPGPATEAATGDLPAPAAV